MAETLSQRYARFYAPLALLTFALAFAPLFDDVVEYDARGQVEMRAHYGTVFDMANTGGGGAAVIGIVLLFSLVGCLAAVAFGARGPALPGTCAGLAALIALMLITKPGTGTPTPHLSGFGAVGLALAVATVVIGGTHAVHLALRRGE
ncbi:MAG TPA: hypothetical protein VL738_27770 [Dactylosporangium sp.]|nr:hypothetical protein [Dactylosporangium sp.]